MVEKITRYFVILAVVILLGFAMFTGSAFAQEDQAPAEKAQENADRLDNSEINIPFIDRDGDGINDMLQNGWGLRFMNRYKKRQALWDQLNVEIVVEDDEKLVDTDGDGEGDIPFREYLKEKMDELIDTDGDGEADTPLRDLLRKRFQTFDRDGDGLPDEFTPEEIRRYMQEMRDWRNQVRDRVSRGQPPFIDENGDGIPDHVPGGPGGPGRGRPGNRGRGGN